MVDSPWTQGRPERPAGTTRWAAGAERAVAILRSRPVPVLVFLWNQVVLVLWWVGQWPGLLSADSVRYLIHVTAGPWTADHSVLYDSFVLASLDLSRNVALLTLAQTTAAAAVVAFTVATIQRYGVPGRWAAVPGLVLPCLPSFGAFVSTVWKDVPFALVEVLVAATMLRIVHRPRRPDGRHDISRGLLVALGLELTGLNLFRNDGFLMVVLLTVALAVALKGVRQKMVAVGVASLLIFAVCHSVIYPAIGIAPASSTLAYGTFYADIAIAYGKDPGEFTAADQAIMSQVTPLKNWRKARNCYSSDPLFRYPGFDKIAADRLKNQLAALWFRTFARSPVTVVWARLCRSSVAWSPLPPPDHRPFYQVVVDTNPILYGYNVIIPADISRNVRLAPLDHGLGVFTRDLRVGTQAAGWQMLLFRGSTWSYVTYLVLFVAARRLRRWDLLVVGAMCLANQLTVMAANPAQLFRYVVGPIFIGMLVVPLLLVPREEPGARR